MAHPKLDELLSYCIPAAQNLLEKNGAFYPIAASVMINGDLSPTALFDGNEHPNAAAMIDQFVTIFRHTRHELDAIAISFDGRVSVEDGKKKDAITVFLEHRNGECVTVYVPYSKKLFRGYAYEPLFAAAAERKVFS